MTLAIAEALVARASEGESVTTTPPDRGPPQPRQMRLGEPACPRCHESFTVSYWEGEILIQARCLSCDLKWPLPYVV